MRSIDVNLSGAANNVASDEFTEVYDDTTDPDYTFVSQTYNENATINDKQWRCYRITNANGSKSWAIDPTTNKRTRAFILQAAGAATYEY